MQLFSTLRPHVGLSVWMQTGAVLEIAKWNGFGIQNINEATYIL